jgi:hypothetical protein
VRRHFATARVSENEFVLIGGDLPVFEAYLCNHCKGECDPLTLIGPALPVMTQHAAASFPFRGKTIVYVFGGYRYTQLSRDLLLFCVKGQSCSAREWDPRGGPPARVGHSFLYHGGQLYLFGGQGEGGLLLDDFWLLDIRSSPLNPEWKRAATGPPARRDHTAWSCGGALYVAGGIGSDRRKLNDIWRFTNVWTKVALFDTLATIQGCDHGLCILGKSFTLFDFEKGENPLGTSFAKLAAKRDRFTHRQATHDRLYLVASTRVNELAAVLKEIKDQPGKRTDDFVSPERLRAVERELAELNVTLLKRVTEFWSGIPRFAFSEPQRRVALKNSLLRPYLKSLVAVRQAEISFKDAEARLGGTIHGQTRDAIVKTIERLTEATLVMPEPIDLMENPVRVDDAMLSYLYSAQLRVIEQNAEKIRALEALRQRQAPQERLCSEKVMEVSMTMKAALQKKVQVESALRKWKDLVLESEQELRRLETCLHFAEDSEAKKAEQVAELEKLNAEIKRLEGSLRKHLSDTLGDKLDRIKRLYKITEDLRVQYKPGTIEEARTTFGAAETEIRSLVKAITATEASK